MIIRGTIPDDLLFLPLVVGCNQPQVNAGAGEFGDRPASATNKILGGRIYAAGRDNK